MEGNTPVQPGLGYGTHTAELNPCSIKSKDFSGHDVTVGDNVKPLAYNPDIDKPYGNSQSISRQSCVPERKVSPLPTKVDHHRTVALKQDGAIFGWLEPGKEGWYMKKDNNKKHLAENVRFSKLEGKKEVEFNADGKHQTYEFSPVIPPYTIATLSQPGE